MADMTLTLAVGAAEIIVGVIAVLFIAGGWIANKLREMQADAERRRRQQQAPMTGSTTRERLDDLAARRREELRRAAAARGGLGTQPGNLTATEHAERERARRVYQQRQAALQQRRDADAAAAADAERMRRAEEAKAELARRRQTQIEQDRREQERRRQIQAETQRRAQVAAQPRAAGPRPARTRQGADFAEAVIIEDDSRTQLRNLLKKGGLRQAFLLREILDRPLAEREMRDPSEG